MIPLELVKQHLNITGDHDDEYISQLIQSAENTLEAECNINICNIPDSQLNIVAMCVCQLVAVMYQYREAASSFEIRSSYIFGYLKALIHNYGEHSFG
jgi:uncharacterized phage protein (predicted DNA packaging)